MESKLRGIDLGNGILLAPHYCSDEEEEINYKPVTPDNYLLKIRDIRQWCKELEEEPNTMVNAPWVAGHLMCILKYGDGYEGYIEPVAPPTPKRSWWRRGLRGK